jgi:hypothetical protein
MTDVHKKINQSLKSPNSSKRRTLSNIFKKTENKLKSNDRLQYLVMVDTIDLIAKWYKKSKKDKLVNQIKQLRGKVHWALIDEPHKSFSADTESSSTKTIFSEINLLDKCRCCNNQLEIKGMVELYAIYVHLPKENKYVEFDEWESEYTKSRLTELIKIFRLLGAKSLVVKINKNSNNQHNTSAEVALNGMEVGAGFEIEKNNNMIDALGYTVKFEGISLDKIRKEYKDKESFIDSNPDLYYLHSNTDWVSYIDQRIGGAEKIECAYIHKKILKASMKLKLKMDKVGVNISSSDKESKKETFEINVKFPEFMN